MCSRGSQKNVLLYNSGYVEIKLGGSTEHIMKEIKNDVERFKIGEIQFDDDTLTANIKHLYSLCDELSKIGLPCVRNGIKVNYHQKKPMKCLKMFT